MAIQFKRMLELELYSEEELIFQDGLFHSPDHHGFVSGANPKSLLQSLNVGLETGKSELLKSDYLVLTFGTAHYYTHMKFQKIFSNCHKIPQIEFTKQRASTNQITDSWIPLIEQILKLNPNLKILLSVSPVRYLKDGYVENQRSKASLLLAAEYLSQHCSCLEYFPAYEIFMDDLRDYRYVEEDLVHPNKIAIDYIWSYFEKAYYNETTLHYKQQLEKFRALAEHRILSTESNSFKSYVEQLSRQFEELHKKYPQADFNFEAQQIEKLKNLLI